MKALETQGIVIREAATQERPSADAFDFKPAPTSPIYANFARKSTDFSIRNRTNSWRASMQSTATQTDDEDHKSNSVPSPQRGSSLPDGPAVKTTQHVTESGDEHDEASPDPNDLSRVSTPDEDVEVHETHSVVAQAKMVQIPKRVPPSLPPRNPSRMSQPISMVETDEANSADEMKDVSLDANQDVNGLAPTDDQFHSIPPSPAPEEPHEASYGETQEKPQEEHEEGEKPSA